MPTNHSQHDSPGCFGFLLKIFGIKRGQPDSSDIQVEHLSADDLPYRLRDDFLSPAEKSFFQILRFWAEDRYTLFSKVSLADLFYVSRPHENRSALNRIDRKHVDFVICDKQTLMPVFAVELDDSSHARPDRMARDRFVNDVFEAAALPLVHIPVRSGYTVAELETQFRGLVNDPPGSQSLPNSAPAPRPTPAGENGAPFCPKCGSRMVLRTVRSGEHAGKQFYGCPNYPNCRSMLPLKGW